MISAAYWSGDLLADYWEMIETFFNEKSNDTIAVEDEICSVRLVIPNHAIVYSVVYIHGSW